MPNCRFTGLEAAGCRFRRVRLIQAVLQLATAEGGICGSELRPGAEPYRRGFSAVGICHSECTAEVYDGNAGLAAWVFSHRQASTPLGQAGSGGARHICAPPIRHTGH
jgi:hypothetical protein